MTPAYCIPLDERGRLLQHGGREFFMTASDLLDLTTLQNLVDLDDGGHGLLSEMIEIFREDTPRRIQDILKATVDGNAEDLSRAGHALKGGAGALGADALRRLAAELEELGRRGSTDAGADLPERLNTTFQASLAALETYRARLQAKRV
jgi:HPt (histidine-containing phosphotransfer) domain-containing protein